jgi:NAD(P)-dependent dehydrogenase (short-subunit alcohol dehydrogenase family)
MASSLQGKVAIVTGGSRVIDTNLTGVFYCCRAAIPHLRRRGGGWIVNISSLAATNAFAEAAAYCASKAGLNAFSDALMQEVRYDDIRVSCARRSLAGRPGTGRLPRPAAAGALR